MPGNPGRPDWSRSTAGHPAAECVRLGWLSLFSKKAPASWRSPQGRRSCARGDKIFKRFDVSNFHLHARYDNQIVKVGIIRKAHGVFFGCDDVVGFQGNELLFQLVDIRPAENIMIGKRVEGEYLSARVSQKRLERFRLGDAAESAYFFIKDLPGLQTDAGCRRIYFGKTVRGGKNGNSGLPRRPGDALVGRKRFVGARQDKAGGAVQSRGGFAKFAARQQPAVSQRPAAVE